LNRGCVSFLSEHGEDLLRET